MASRTYRKIPLHNVQINFSAFQVILVHLAITLAPLQTTAKTGGYDTSLFKKLIASL